MSRQNGITIEEVLKMDCMKNCKIIAGFKGIKNTISSVNVMADPDVISWVEEGDLLLMTGYSFKKITLQEQKNIIKESSKKGLAGIGIKVHPYLETLPSEVLELAENLNFPVIDIYYATPLSDIMTPIFNEIFNRQAYLLKKIEKIYEQFMNAMLKGQNIKDITNLIGDNIKNPVLVKLDVQDKEISQFELIESDKKDILFENVLNFYKNPNRYSEKKIDESNELLDSKYIKRIVVPVIAKDSVFGHIFAWGVNKPLGGYALSVLEIASTTIALEVLKILSVREVENRYKSEFIEDLISLDSKRKEKAIERASFFNLNRNDKFLSVTIKIKGKDNVEEKNFTKLDGVVNSLELYLSKVHDHIERSIRDLELTGVVASKTELIIILLSFKDDESIERALNEFSKQIESIDERFKSIDMSVGIGRVNSYLENFANSYIDSIKAISTGKILKENLVTNFENLGIFKILSQDHLEEELSKFYDGTIKPLVDYDEKKSTELVKTLQSYFDNNGNLKKMSDELFTHYNTVLYRVQRIMEITNMDLENPNDRLNLEISLKIKQLLGK
ncbi:purine catabolism regulatory protein PucR [Gottschalkia acidurici 9a]|uniref:Purine catabolism regulatory protein PucR n=1 Tax=Gottschalkia acidurici (strain ATCC 7906 / DSM 604 / BCRC 14475 / CIP 104303 / KCTC 5404 / NCIMB 10678 / 9a) TaxID=1128398 RepID=K0B5Y8_GOTA9|nr:PucR family transcriptional regulator [Gottschalkia acidurici]AFS79881.1 purine catabolism regulatory protein PucR [Gottschalkia acidurici 9a]